MLLKNFSPLKGVLTDFIVPEGKVDENTLRLLTAISTNQTLRRNNQTVAINSLLTITAQFAVAISVPNMKLFMNQKGSTR